MKKIGKKILTAALASALVLTLTACTSSQTTPSPSASAEPLKIGVIQYAPHPSLDNCYTGFVQGLEEAGYVDGEAIKIDFQNAQGDTSRPTLSPRTWSPRSTT